MPWNRLWAYRGPLVGVVVVVLVPVLLASYALSLWDAGPDATVVDGGLYAPPPHTPWLPALVGAVGWLFAVSAGTVAAGGALSDHALPVRAALRLAVTAFPRILAVCAVVAGCAFVVLEVFVHVLGSLSGSPVFFAVALIVAMGAALTRVLAAIPAVVLDGRPGRFIAHAHRVVRGRAAVTTVLVTFWIIAVPAVAVLALRRVDAGIPVGWTGDTASWLAGTLAGVSVAVLQSSALAWAYLRPRRPEEAGETADPDWIATRLGRLAQPTGAPSVPRPAAGASHRAARSRIARTLTVVACAVTVALPAAASAAVTRGDVLGLTRVSAGTVDLHNSFHQIKAVGWPPGQHPVFVMFNEIIRCLDDTCRHSTRATDNNLQLATGFAVAPDGSVVTVGPDRRYGRDQVVISRCPVKGPCTSSPFTWPVTADGPPTLALAVTDDGAILIGAVQQFTASGRTPVLRLTLTRCDDATCTHPATVELPAAEAGSSPVPTDPNVDTVSGVWLDPAVASMLRVGTDGTGRPAIVLALPGEGILGACTTATCAAATFTRFATPPDLSAVAVDPTGLATRVLALADGAVQACDADRCTLTAFTDYQDPAEGALATEGNGIDVVLSPYTSDGLLLTIGQPPAQPRILTLWRCADVACPHPRTTRLATSTGGQGDARIAVNPDGRVLVAVPSTTGFTNAALYLVPAG